MDSNLPLILGLRLADFWLPPNYAAHGAAMDGLFTAITWLTMAVLLAVQGVLVYFLIRYRRRPGKAQFTHGNIRLEMLWTIIPAVILLVLAMVSKRVWDQYRYSGDLTDPRSHHVLVVAQQFNWNTFYAGADNKLGQYLAYPRPTDAYWPRDSKGNRVRFRGVDGPARLPAGEAESAVNAWVAGHPFGKVEDPVLDPAGADDYVKEPQGVLTLPVGEATVIDLTSKDVIHDFYLPNFRVNVYAVPGMRVQVSLRPTRKSADFEESKVYAPDDLPAVLSDPANAGFAFEINEDAPGQLGKNKEKDRFGWRYFSTAGKTKATIIRNEMGFLTRTEAGRPVADPASVAKIVAAMKAAGLTQVRGRVPFFWEIECASCAASTTRRWKAKFT